MRANIVRPRSVSQQVNTFDSDSHRPSTVIDDSGSDRVEFSGLTGKLKSVLPSVILCIINITQPTDRPTRSL